MDKIGKTSPVGVKNNDKLVIDGIVQQHNNHDDDNDAIVDKQCIEHNVVSNDDTNYDNDNDNVDNYDDDDDDDDIDDIDYYVIQGNVVRVNGGTPDTIDYEAMYADFGEDECLGFSDW